jgi:hypothetical protein
MALSREIIRRRLHLVAIPIERGRTITALMGNVSNTRSAAYPFPDAGDGFVQDSDVSPEMLDQQGILLLPNGNRFPPITVISATAGPQPLHKV